MKRFVFYSIVGIIVVVAGVFLFQKDMHARRTHHAIQCISNLKHIDAAKEFLAQEHKLKSGDPVPVEKLVSLKAWPKTCPSGGTYTINPVDQTPTCTVPGHTLP
jgi:hypothetical protein